MERQVLPFSVNGIWVIVLVYLVVAVDAPLCAFIPRYDYGV